MLSMLFDKDPEHQTGKEQGSKFHLINLSSALFAVNAKIINQSSNTTF
jgi:hypothetical protein